jgi:hypothetical protein
MGQHAMQRVRETNCDWSASSACREGMMGSSLSHWRRYRSLVFVVLTECVKKENHSLQEQALRPPSNRQTCIVKHYCHLLVWSILTEWLTTSRSLLCEHEIGYRNCSELLSCHPFDSPTGVSEPFDEYSGCRFRIRHYYK